MPVSVSYACPHCGAIVHVERDPELDDKSVTTDPQPGWKYVSPDGDLASADGIAFLCGEDGPVRTPDGSETTGCGRPYYLNFVRYRQGVELEPEPATYDGPRFDFRP